MIKGGKHHEKVSQSLVVLHPGDYVGPVPRQWHGRPVNREVVSMEGFANLVSMLDYVVDSRRKRHITGGLLITAAMLFGGLAITVMTIRDEEDSDYE